MERVDSVLGRVLKGLAESEAKRITPTQEPLTAFAFVIDSPAHGQVFVMPNRDELTDDQWTQAVGLAHTARALGMPVLSNGEIASMQKASAETVKAIVSTKRILGGRLVE